MSFFDKAKAKIKQTTDTAKEKISTAVDEHNKKVEQKKELEEQKRELEEQNYQNAQNEFDKILEEAKNNVSETNVFSNCNTDNLLAFTKDFYEKICLPATKWEGYPLFLHSYIEMKKIEKIKKSYAVDYKEDETPIIHYQSTLGDGFILTDKSLYLGKTVPETGNKKLIGNLPINNISSFNVKEEDETTDIYINEINLISFVKDTSMSITLNRYFEMIRENDFDITNEEVSENIIRKLDPKIYSYIKNYIFDDELLIFIALGSNSATASDYIICTTNRLLLIDRQAFGLSQNIRAFDYEDINSIGTAKGTQSGGLLDQAIVGLIDTGLKLCHIEVSVAGRAINIQNLNQIEGERVIKLVNDYKRSIKQSNKQPQVIQAQPIQSSEPDILGQIEKLSELHKKGILSEDEFNVKKAALLEKL